jgi:polysaccharide deacetylase family protein (PEP-CTERM system associated)
MKNIFSVDVEDYFHPSELTASAPRDQWESLPSRVERSTEELLEVMDRRRAKGTFFVLGWVARQKPGLVRSIASGGHEVACHSYSHRLVYSMTPDEFREDTRLAIEAIEEACGVRPASYRAPSYSITKASLWALDILAEAGFTHDSSIYPIVHDRYGIPGFPRFASRQSTRSGALVEVPPASVILAGGRTAPVGGGGYLRLLPYRYTAAGIRRINREEGKPACVYVHPWEIDDGQPRMAQGTVARMRTYLGLRTMKSKIDRLLGEFEWGPMREVAAAEALAA